MSTPWYERIVGSGCSPVGGAGREVLVVDDHPDAREMISLLLKRLGLQVRLAASGEEAHALMASRVQEVGLALVDVILADIDGMSVARELRAHFPKLGIVMMSGQLNDESRWIVSEEGFRFLPKPFTFQQLRDVVAELLGDAGANTP